MRGRSGSSAAGSPCARTATPARSAVSRIRASTSSTTGSARVEPSATTARPVSELAQEQDVVDQLADALDLRPRLLDERHGVLRRKQRRLQQGEQARERRPQLVRDGRRSRPSARRRRARRAGSGRAAPPPPLDLVRHPDGLVPTVAAEQLVRHRTSLLDPVQALPGGAVAARTRSSESRTRSISRLSSTSARSLREAEASVFSPRSSRSLAKSHLTAHEYGEGPDRRRRRRHRRRHGAPSRRGRFRPDPVENGTAGLARLRFERPTSASST